MDESIRKVCTTASGSQTISAAREKVLVLTLYLRQQVCKDQRTQALSNEIKGVGTCGLDAGASNAFNDMILHTKHGSLLDPCTSKTW